MAVFRISGPRAGEVLDAFCGGRGAPRTARLVTMRLADGTVLDQGLVLWFPGPASFTGEDVAELHLHGSPAVERAFTDAMTAFGLVPATAGAFTLRAFEAGKLDLAQAEGLGDLLSAETDAQRRQALGQLGGALSERAEAWRARLLAAMAATEASVDFPDEADVPDGIGAAAAAPLRAMLADMEAALAQAGGAARLRDGVTVVLTGPPNAGKSSLLNRLAGSERAIVSDEAGTTRDLLEVRMELGGHLVTMIDTAGIRDSASEVERQGIDRARRAANEADLRVEVQDARSVTGPPPPEARTVWVASKTDLLAPGTDLPQGWLGASVIKEGGTNSLLAAVTRIVGEGGQAGVLTRRRHVALIGSAATDVRRTLGSQQEPEIVAEELRMTLSRIDELTGRIAPDEVLGEVFSAFCIGK